MFYIWKRVLMNVLRLLKQMDKPTSLDLLCIPPTITITPNTGDSSDNDLNVMPSDGKLMDNRNQLRVPSAGMCYLSPFSMCSRNDRSEGNLSSSGYSSMASPGPSRCGSNNPLLPGEMEDPGCGNYGKYILNLCFSKSHADTIFREFHALSSHTSLRRIRIARPNCIKDIGRIRCQWIAQRTNEACPLAI